MYISYEFISASPAMSCMSGSPNLNSFRDRGQVAVQLVSCGVLLPGLIYINNLNDYYYLEYSDY